MPRRTAPTVAKVKGKRVPAVANSHLACPMHPGQHACPDILYTIQNHLDVPDGGLSGAVVVPTFTDPLILSVFSVQGVDRARRHVLWVLDKDNVDRRVDLGYITTLEGRRVLRGMLIDFIGSDAEIRLSGEHDCRGQYHDEVATTKWAAGHGLEKGLVMEHVHRLQSGLCPPCMDLQKTLIPNPDNDTEVIQGTTIAGLIGTTPDPDTSASIPFDVTKAPEVGVVFTCGDDPSLVGQFAYKGPDGRTVNHRGEPFPHRTGIRSNSGKGLFSAGGSFTISRDDT